ncbi:hypothetical protein YH66_05190 [[Brevibacterium] flavum]|uniref:Uncharacterized protein n=1 Tax=[Brevibacterium] flavum TaxID=92706 RepID=A0A0F6Z5A7_9CORY|nr:MULTISPECIES: hypothetical protein [Corynebacterium]AKF26993.1 hypothetical protein YH66_05190 [[Brevibacterium] flavum]ANE07815.1 hypothetical protein A3654_05180 [Corynebacterium glutamicum]AST20231.1 hypothetical protein CEY17_05245 [Corynebacterium glutamicum ATCC 14067]KEI22705.1 hypothetical protein KIQ_009020 [Corynebacterium glutamicum ATCC 14067]KIH74250.1 hypothetical protein SD36_05215 [Corynebacterium glutamicum]
MAGTHFCKFCGEPIFWIHTEAGRLIPLDPGSDTKRGTFALRVTHRPDGTARRVAVGLTIHERVEAIADGELLFLAHQAVCSGTRSVGGGAPIPAGVKSKMKQIIDEAKKSR